MKGAVRIATVFGIGIFLHWTFSLIIAYVAFLHLSSGDGWIAALEGVGLVLIVFACVVLHELGHALSARHYGIGTRDIMLLPIGGIARLERMPEEPKQELVVALAGPAVNLAIVGFCSGLLYAADGFSGWTARPFGTENLIVSIMTINAVLFAFNLVPAFPMDGGRVLRALLALKLDYVFATRCAAITGQTMAVLFALLGMTTGNPFLLLIALFVFLGARAEAAFTQSRFVLRDLNAEDVMVTRFECLDPNDSLDRAVAMLCEGSQSAFPVVREGAVMGIVTAERIIQTIGKSESSEHVSGIMEAAPTPATVGDGIDPTLDRIRESTFNLPIPVLKNGTIVGLITTESIRRASMIRNALQKAERNQSRVLGKAERPPA